MLDRLADALRAQGGLLAEAARDPADGATARHGPLAAEGPRAAADPERYALLVEAIREGYLLHYGNPRVVDAPDGDLALLAGDQLYALGLAELAAVGDLEAVAELSDVISLVAQAHAGADPELADAVWEAGAVAVGWGSGDAHRAAKARARREAGAGGAADAARELRAVARAGRDGGAGA